jgi:hypothetical protein
MKPEDKAVVQLALEAFASCNGYRGDRAEYLQEFNEAKVMAAETALRQLLEQPEEDCPHGADSACKECHEAAQPTPTHGPYSAPIKHLWPVAQPAEPDYKQLYEQLCEQYDVLVNELKGTQPADHGDELTIAYLDGAHTGKQIAKREWVGLMRGVRVDGDTVVISTKNNYAARHLCALLLYEKGDTP